MKLEKFCLHHTTAPHLKLKLREMLADKTRRWRVDIRPWRDTRSLPQNSLFHQWCAVISQELQRRGGKEYTPEYVKEALKASFLGSEVVERKNVLTGEMVTTEEIRHTSDLDKGEMHFFMERVWHWCLNVLGVILPTPDGSEYQKLQSEQVE